MQEQCLDAPQGPTTPAQRALQQPPPPGQWVPHPHSTPGPLFSRMPQPVHTTASVCSLPSHAHGPLHRDPGPFFSAEQMDLIKKANASQSLGGCTGGAGVQPGGPLLAEKGWGGHRRLPAPLGVPGLADKGSCQLPNERQRLAVGPPAQTPSPGGRPALVRGGRGGGKGFCPALRPKEGGPATVTSNPGRSGCVSSGLRAGSCRRTEGRRQEEAVTRTTTEEPVTGPARAGVHAATAPAGSWGGYSHAAHWTMEAQRPRGPLRWFG